MSADRQFPPLDYDIQRALRDQRGEIANQIQLYPLDSFCWDTNNHGEILRLRDTISEAIRKNVPAGERIR